MTKKIIHIDMDCFYAAIEMRDNPQFRLKPIAVGGSAAHRGVIATCNYQARRYGVHSAMATAYALRLCPALIVVPVTMAKYRAVALEIRKIFSYYTAQIEFVSLDEAYLDVSESSHFSGSATRIAQAIRASIFAEHKLTASAGIAPNKFLAKVASDWNKPDGQFVITPAQVIEFMAQLPVNKIPGVGKVTAKKLQAKGLYTCTDLQKLPLAELIYHFGTFGQRLYEYCRGIDQRAVEPQRIRKSVSVEETYSKDLTNLTDCLAALPDLWLTLNERLKPYSQRRVKNQFLKMKFDDFSQTTVEMATDDLNMSLYLELCKVAYERYRLPVRLLGLGVHFKSVADLSKQFELDFV